MRERHNREINWQLRTAREQRMWSEEKAAEEIGVDLQTYHRWETGKQGIRLSSLNMLCAAFGESPEHLGFGHRFAKIEDVAPSQAIPEAPETPQQEEEEGLSLERQESLLVRLTPEEAALLLPFIEKSTQMDEVKRKTLKRLIAVAKLATIAPLSLAVDPEPMERLSQAMTTTPSVMNTHSFKHFQELLNGCWGLNNNGEMDSASEVLSSFLPKMVQFAPDSTEAAVIAAQGLRLESLLSAHQLRIPEMVPLCQKSVEYARKANDPDVLSAALNGLAVAYKYAQQPEASFKAYQEALYYSDQASPLLRTRVYAGAAAAFAQRGRLKEADFYIHLAYDDFPEEPEHDINFLTADNGLYMLSYYEGLIYLQRGLPKQAIEAFMRYKTLRPGIAIPARNELEIVNHQGRAAIFSGNQEYYVQLLEEGIAGALTLRSKKRYDEAIRFFRQDVPQAWRSDSRVQQMIERFSLPIGEPS